MMNLRDKDAARKAPAFVVLIGVVSLFADMTYEGSRSITGPFLGTLGATGAIVAIVAGAGELLGYLLRFGTGWLADSPGRRSGSRTLLSRQAITAKPGGFSLS